MDKKRCLSCGKCDKKFCYIIIVIIIIFLFYVPLVIFIRLKYARGEINYLSIINVMSYGFFMNLCESFMIIPNLILNKNISNISSESIDNDNTIEKRNKTNLSIQYIFNKNKIKFSLKEKIIFVFAVLLKLSLNIIYILYQYYLETEYDFLKVINYAFEFELISLFLLSKFMYSIPYYKHQYISIIIITLIITGKFIYQFIKKDDGHFFLHLIIHLIYSSFKSFFIVYIKGLMEYKYMSPYKVCYLFGFINFVIITIVYIIVSFIPCENELCQVEYNDNKYFGHIFAIFNIFGLFMFLFSIIKAIFTILTYIIINDYSVCHSFLIFQLLSISSLANPTKNASEAIIEAFVFFVNFFFILLFLEIIEVNICKISYNTKKNIASRAINDMEYSIISWDEKYEEEEID